HRAGVMNSHEQQGVPTTVLPSSADAWSGGPPQADPWTGGPPQADPWTGGPPQADPWTGGPPQADPWTGGPPQADPWTGRPPQAVPEGSPAAARRPPRPRPRPSRRGSWTSPRCSDSGGPGLRGPAWSSRLTARCSPTRTSSRERPVSP